MKIGVCTSKGLSINLLQKESDMKSVGIVLSGCGVFDGSEIHESVLSLLSLTQSGAQVYFCLLYTSDAADDLRAV